MKKIRASQIATKALKIRKKFLLASPNSPICPFNLADSMGFDIRFIKIPSFEGMYLAEENIILISSDRPEGRKSFTCAHELGHFVLGHGTVIDEIIEDGSDKEIEKEADFFAGMILMPSSVVKSAANKIGIDFKSITHEQTYILSKYLGVSFLGLINQLKYILKFIDQATFEKLKKVSLPNIKEILLGEKTKGEVFVVGNWWTGRAIDVSVGDYLILEEKTELEGLSLIEMSDKSGVFIYQAVRSGITKISNNNSWNAFVRVSRKKYEGMYQYMHLEDDE